MATYHNNSISQVPSSPVSGTVGQSAPKKSDDQFVLAAVLKPLQDVVAATKAQVDAASGEGTPKRNWMDAVMRAIMKDSETESQIQINDALMTQTSASIETAMNKAYYAPYNPANPGSGGLLTKDYNKLDQDIANKASQQTIEDDQAKLQTDTATAQSNISQQDGSTQAAQGQVSADASNLQNKAQIPQQTIFSIQQNSTSVLNSGVIA